MFLNCGEFVEINSNLRATYLFNDLSKTFTNALQITKFYKNLKKFLNARAGQTAGRMQIIFCSSPIFNEKLQICGRVDFLFFCSSMLCTGNLDPHFPKRGDCVKKVEYYWYRLYGKIYFCVIESK